MRKIKEGQIYFEMYGFTSYGWVWLVLNVDC